MLSLSPAKLLVVLVIALIVLGPEKLPGMARQVGAAWGDLRRFRSRLESEVRGVFPDLPPAHEVAQAVRSPLAFLNRLADEHDRGQVDGDAPLSEEPASAPNGESPGEPRATDPAGRPKASSPPTGTWPGTV
ncbi:MAG: twin-arginine translocase TatA/TatE family subunit, partial [Acidimicrobiales bacterium]